MKYGRLILKNILRNKRRALLTVSSLAVSLFLIVTLATVVTEFTRASDQANPLRLVVRHGVSLTFFLPIAYRQRIAALPGVVHVLPYEWFGGEFKDSRNFFANFAVDASLLRLYLPEAKMSEAEWAAFAADRQGAIIGRKLAALYGFRQGQRVTLKSPIYRMEPEFILRGIYSGGDEKTLFFHYNYLNEAGPVWHKDRTGTFGIMARSAADVPRIAQAVDAMFLNTDAPTKTENEREFAMSFESMMGNVKQFMFGIMGAIMFSLLLVMANTMSMSVRERRVEVGTLKAIGFTRAAIAWLFLSESLILAAVGGALGVGGSALAFRLFDVSVYIPNFSRFEPLPSTLAGVYALAMLAGAVSVAYSAYRISGMTIAEALRRVE